MDKIKYIRLQNYDALGICHVIVEFLNGSRTCSCGSERGVTPNLRQDEIVRRDRYTIVVEGYAVRATDEQERRIRQMDAAARARFLTIMGRDS